MSFFDNILIWLGFKERFYTNPDHIKVKNHILDHSQEVKDGFWDACAKLEKGGYCKSHKHKITKFKFRAGEKRQPRGWAVWDPANKMWIGGNCGLAEIMIVVNPTDGRLNASGKTDIAHEWGHALLNEAGIHRFNREEQHKIMASVGL